MPGRPHPIPVEIRENYPQSLEHAVEQALSQRQEALRHVVSSCRAQFLACVRASPCRRRFVDCGSLR